ncbi:MAG: EamA family transporter [Pseudobdellovibrio sp.]
MISIQFGASIAKQLFPVLGAAGTTALRVCFSALILLLIANPIKNKNIFKKIILDFSHSKNLFLYGLSLGLMNVFFYFALEKIPLGLAVSLEFIGPLEVAIFYSRKVRDFLWVGLAAVGLSVLFFNQENVSGPHVNFLGILYALIAGFFWGCYIIFGKLVVTKNYPTMLNSSVGMCWAGLVALTAGLIFNFSQIILPQYWVSGVLIAVLSSAVPYTLEMKAMEKIPEKTFGVLMSFEPVIATTTGLIFLKEKLESNQIAAMIFIIIACFGSSFFARLKEQK